MRPDSLFGVALLVTAGTACAGSGDQPPRDTTFEAVVEDVLAPRCTFSSCHASPTVAAGLDLTAEHACDMLVNQPSCLFPDRTRIVPGHPETSFFFHKLTGQELDEPPAGRCAQSNLLMPFGGAALPDAELALVHAWISAGASCSPNPDKPPPEELPPAIAALSASRGAPLAGETIAITVTLNRPAPEGGQTITLATDSSALSAPVQVVVPGAMASARFEAYALRPTSRFTLRATTGQSSKQLVLRIAGLEIAEVLADPVGPDDERQWIKLRNRSSLPLDLSSYQLRAGVSNYDLVTVPLVGTIPAGGCAVIGGPKQSLSNSEPVFAQAINFTPDLPFAPTGAAGFAVFDGAAAPVTAPINGVSTPVDLMLVGANNAAQLVGPDAEIASPYCATPISGTSALRTGPGTCVQAEMQPNTCL